LVDNSAAFLMTLEKGSQITNQKKLIFDATRMNVELIQLNA